jgi:hypothetical protein
MASAYKTLYENQLPNSVTTLVTVPGGKSWIIKDISLVNTDSVDHTVALYRNGTTAPFLMTPAAVNIVAGGMYAFSGGTIALETGATIAGVADTASKVTIKISGDEVS